MVLRLGFWVLEFRVWGSEFGVEGLGFRVWGLGFGVSRIEAPLLLLLLLPRWVVV